MTFVMRGLVSVVAGWITAATGIVLGLRLFNRSAMAVVGPGSVLVGLVVIVVCWRSTRNWAPRKATSEELISGVDVHLSYPFLAFLTVVGLISFGMLALPFWIQTRRWPRLVDPEGMTLRNGSQIAWSDVKEVTQGVKTFGGNPVSRWWDLHAGKVQATIVPNGLREGWAVVEFTSRALGQTWTVR